jgi:hypothetical protein
VLLAARVSGADILAERPFDSHMVTARDDQSPVRSAEAELPVVICPATTIGQRGFGVCPRRVRRFRPASSA